MLSKALQFDFKSFWRDLRTLRFLQKYVGVESKNLASVQGRLVEHNFPSVLVQDLVTAYLAKKERLELADLFRLGLGLLHSRYKAPADFLFGRILDVRTDFIYGDAVLVFTIQKYVAPVTELFRTCEVISASPLFVQVLSQSRCLTSKSTFKDTVGLWINGTSAGRTVQRIRSVLLHDTVVRRNQRFWKIRTGVSPCPVCSVKHTAKNTVAPCSVMAIPVDLGESLLW